MQKTFLDKILDNFFLKLNFSYYAVEEKNLDLKIFLDWSKY